jgi:energy-coupling factor transporter transmembrane protein EcfT
MATTPATLVMKGGFREQVTDLFSRYEGPVALLVGTFATLVIVFVGKVPVDIRRQADSMLGRAFLLTFTALTTLVFGWPLGVLVGLMSALLIGAGVGRNSSVTDVKGITEGFTPDLNVRLVPNKKKWFVEKVLGENPLLIEDSVIDTSAVQDLTEKNSGSVQSNTVTR